MYLFGLTICGLPQWGGWLAPFHDLSSFCNRLHCKSSIDPSTGTSQNNDLWKWKLVLVLHTSPKIPLKLRSVDEPKSSAKTWTGKPSKTRQKVQYYFKSLRTRDLVGWMVFVAQLLINHRLQFVVTRASNLDVRVLLGMSFLRKTSHYNNSQGDELEGCDSDTQTPSSILFCSR